MKADQARLLAALRASYEQSVRDLGALAVQMQREGAATETIARALNEARRGLAIKFKEQTPEPYRTQIYERTRSVYGREDGPSVDFLRAKGKSWDDIIESASSSGDSTELFCSRSN